MRRVALFCLIIAACNDGTVVEPTTSSQDGTQTTSIASSDTGTTTPTVVTESWDLSKPFVGFSLSPRAFDEEGMDDFFATASTNGSLIAWVGPWPEIDRGGSLVTGFAGEHDYVPVVVTGFPSEGGGRVLPDSEQEMADTISGFLTQNPIPYLGFGVEVNYYLWEQSPEAFDRFTIMFERVADVVHETSPDTRVFPVFQLERLKGLKGGLFGE